jgi:hypothetical protein
MIKKFFKYLIVFIFAVLFALPVYAQNSGEGLTISPPISDLTLKLGDVSEQTVRLTNPTDKLMEVYPQVQNFRAKGEGGEPDFYPASSDDTNFALASWIKFSQSKIALTPEQVAEFKYQITVPKNAEPGGHYGVVFFATEPPKTDTSSNQVSVASKIGSLILVKIPGDIKESGQLTDFSANKFFFKGPVLFTTRIQNSGNIHFKPKGQIIIKNWQGKSIESIEFNAISGNVLPESTRKFEEKWQPSIWTFGYFSANLALSYGDTNQTLQDKLVFWIIPWWVIVSLIIVIIALMLIIWRRKRKKPKASPKGNERKFVMR